MTGLCKLCGEMISPAAVSRMPLPQSATPEQRQTAAYGFACVEHVMKHHKQHAQMIQTLVGVFHGLLAVVCTECTDPTVTAELATAKQKVLDALEGPAGLMKPAMKPASTIVS